MQEHQLLQPPKVRQARKVADTWGEKGGSGEGMKGKGRERGKEGPLLFVGQSPE